MKLEFSGPSARDGDNWQANTSRLVNLYREPSGGKTQYTLKSVLGTSAFATVSGVFVRSMAEVGGAIYVASNGRLQKVTANALVSDLGGMTDGTDGSIAGNNGKVTVCIGGLYYLWDGSALTQPLPGAFSAFGSLDYIGNYTVLTELNGRRFQWSGIADANTLPGLNFSTADGRDDNIIRCAAINGVLYIFKQKSHEVWYVTGGAGAAAFERQSGGIVDIGLKSFGLLTKITTGGAFFIGDDGRAHVVGIGPVSIPPVETAIRESNPQYCLSYEDEGHAFCAIIFRDAPAWVFDIALGEWHERADGVDLGPWQATVSAKLDGAWYIGRTGGAILKLERTNADAGLPLARVAVSNTLDNDGKLIALREFEAFMRIGFEAGSVELRLSRDSGHTWTAPKPRAWAVGDYKKRLIWKAQGQGRQLTAELRMTDPIEVPINSSVRIAV